MITRYSTPYVSSNNPITPNIPSETNADDIPRTSEPKRVYFAEFRAQFDAVEAQRVQYVLYPESRAVDIASS